MTEINLVPCTIRLKTPLELLVDWLVDKTALASWLAWAIASVTAGWLAAWLLTLS
jgi:hypothetical protein